MTFEWDEAKNRINIGKHGVSFETAARIFDGPVLSRVDDRNEYGEVRTLSIGRADGVVILTVVHTKRAAKTRIISARPADRNERKRYEETIQKRIGH